MTDEQKAAKKLFDKCLILLEMQDIWKPKFFAQLFALIAIDEALAYACLTDEDTIEFLKGVKQEIKKL